MEEVKVGIQILESLNLKQRRLEIVSCPSCGRAQVDVYKLAEQVTAGLEGMEVPLRVAVMGCVVNGPGEAREADLGVASGNGKGQIFVKGEVIKTVPESKIVETLIEEAMKLAEQMEADGVPRASPAVGGGLTRRARRPRAASPVRCARRGRPAGDGRAPRAGPAAGAHGRGTGAGQCRSASGRPPRKRAAAHGRRGSASAGTVRGPADPSVRPSAC